MTPGTDPYRTLGLARGASLEEIRRAYRALAKVNHPDAGGPAALPRFLAIQAAYEQLVASGAGRRSARPAPASSSRPSAADPDRADAANRAYGGRARRGRGETSGSDGSATGSGQGRDGTPPGAGQGRPGTTPGAGTGGSPGRARPRPEAGRTGGSGSGSGGSPRPRRDPGATAGPEDWSEADPTQPKATLGSTSYDGADKVPFEPDWGGASWYGTSSGTYWTINPKEYADPRKHGPEYQARARRQTRRRAGTGEDQAAVPPEAAGLDDADGSGEAGPPPSAEGDAPPARGTTHATASWWAAGTSADDAPAAPHPGTGRAERAAPRPRTDTVDDPPPDLAAAATDLGRALMDERTGHGRWRAVQAVVGWLPILFGAAWLVDELTGCGRFAASCGAGAPVIAPVIGLLVLGILLLSPWLAAVAATGALALVLAAVPTALLLSAGGTAIDVQSRSDTLGIVLVVAWVVGIAFAIARRVRSMGSRARPVS
jgi:DnaJ domain